MFGSIASFFFFFLLVLVLRLPRNFSHLAFGRLSLLLYHLSLVSSVRLCGNRGSDCVPFNLASSLPTSRASSSLKPFQDWMKRPVLLLVAAADSIIFFSPLRFLQFSCCYWGPLLCPSLRLSSPLSVSHLLISTLYTAILFVLAVWWINYGLNRMTVMRGGSMDALLHALLFLSQPSSTFPLFFLYCIALRQHHCIVG